MAGRLTRGEVRFVRFPPPDKQRPALLLTRNSALLCAVNLHNVITVSQERVGRRICQLPDTRMDDVCAALEFALGCGR